MIVNQIIYQSKQRVWEQRACVRSRPRIIINKDADQYYYPLDRVPIALHPNVQRLGEQAKCWLLVQALYKYLRDIALVETDTVVSTSLKLINDSCQYQFPQTLIVDLMSVVVDEGYHAYIALDFARQVEQITQIKPVTLPNKIELTHALELTKSTCDVKIHPELEYIAVCIAENTITKDLASIKARDDVVPEFYTMVADHMLDEGRHCMIFTSTLALIWQQMPTTKKSELIKVLPHFIHHYLDLTIQINFDRQCLLELGLNNHNIEQVINDSYKVSLENTVKEHPMRVNISNVLTRAGIELVY